MMVSMHHTTLTECVNLKLRPWTQHLVHKTHSVQCTPIRRLVASATGPIIVHHPLASNTLFLDPCTALAHRPQTYTMPNDVETLDALALGESRTCHHRSFHDTHRQVRVDLRFPIPLLVTPAQNCTSTSGSGHDVTRFTVAIVCSREIHHFSRVVPHYHDLCACRNDRCVFNATQCRRSEACAVDHYIGLTRWYESSSFPDILENCSLEDNTVLKTL